MIAHFTLEVLFPDKSTKTKTCCFFLTITSHLWPARIVPRICRTILAKSQNRHPMLCFPLLLAGIPISTYRIGESVSQKAIVGIFPRAASLMGCKQLLKVSKERKHKSSTRKNNTYADHISKQKPFNNIQNLKSIQVLITLSI